MDYAAEREIMHEIKTPNPKSQPQMPHDADKYLNEKSQRIIRRAEKDLENGDLQKAISRYEGFFQYYPELQAMHNRVAALYIQAGDRIRAGRHLYLKEQLTDMEQECVQLFEKRYGNSPTILLKKRIAKQHFRIRDFDAYSQQKIKTLLEAAIVETGIIPNFLKGMKGYFDKKREIN